MPSQSQRSACSPSMRRVLRTQSVAGRPAAQRWQRQLQQQGQHRVPQSGWTGGHGPCSSRCHCVHVLGRKALTSCSSSARRCRTTGGRAAARRPHQRQGEGQSRREGRGSGLMCTVPGAPALALLRRQCSRNSRHSRSEHGSWAVPLLPTKVQRRIWWCVVGMPLLKPGLPEA